MKKRVWIFLFLLLLACGVHGARKALVIGNASYSDRPLRNPVNDANLISSTLKELDFEVVLLTNADLQQMESALNRFITSISANDEAVFYYSGHGANYNGDNYLIPLGWEFTDEEELRYKAFNSNLALNLLQKSRLSIMILDACRDNPYRGARSGSKGLATMQGKSGSQYVIYSTEQGKTAADGTGANSPFTESFAKHIKSPDRVEDVMKKVAIELKTKTNDKQIPWSGGTLVEDFYFAKAIPGTEMRVTPRNQGLERLTGDLRITTDFELELFTAKKSLGKVKPGYALNLPNQPVGDLILEFWWENAKYSLKSSIYENRITTLEIKSETLSKLRNDAFQTTIKSMPESADLSFKDYPGFKFHTPFVFYDIFPASYELSLKAPRYDELKVVIETGKQRKAESISQLVAKFAELSISSEPSGSRIWLNGKEMGTTPQNFKGAQQGIDPGLWKLKLEPVDPMYLPAEKNLELKANQYYDVNLMHHLNSSGLQISSDIYPIAVSIDDGKTTTLNSAQIIKLNPGNHTVVVSYAGNDSRTLKTWQGSVEILREKMISIDVKLIPQTGTLQLSSNMKDYEAKVVDLETGNSLKLSNKALDTYPGSYSFEAVKWGFYVINREIDIKEGLQSELRLEFEPIPKRLLMPYYSYKTHQKLSLSSLALTLGLSAFAYCRADQAHKDYMAADSPYSTQDARKDFENTRQLFYGSCGLNIIPIAYYVFSLSKTHQNRAKIELEMRSQIRR